MTREQVLAMSAQELAEATAVHVMGWEWQQPPSVGNVVERGYWWSLSLEEPVYDWNPAEEISSTWKITEKMRPFTFDLFRSDGRNPSEEWVCIFSWDVGLNRKCERVYAPTAELAISRCALLAVMGI